MPLINIEAIKAAILLGPRKRNYYLVSYVSYSYYRYKGYPDHTISIARYEQLRD